MKYESNIFFRKLRVILGVLFVASAILAVVEGNWFASPVLLVTALGLFYYLGRIHYQVEVRDNELVFTNSSSTKSLPLNAIDSVSQGGFGPSEACLTVISEGKKVILWPELSSKRINEFLETLKSNNPNMRVSINTLK